MTNKLVSDGIQKFKEDIQGFKEDIGDAASSVKKHKGKILGAIAGLSIFGAVADHRHEKQMAEVRKEVAEAIEKGEIQPDIIEREQLPFHPDKQNTEDE